MQTQPLISIITTYYNSVQLGDFVKSSMQCLQNQTYQNLELICVNDGSTDSTLNELESFAKQDSRIKVYTKENQKYAQYSKAYGQEKASGEFIFLFDHDDLIDFDTIEKCYQTFLSHPELDIVTPIVITKFTDGNIKNIHNIYFSDSATFEFKKFTGSQIIKDTVGKYDNHIRGLYRKEVFKSHSFRFTEPLLNADEIVERLIYEEARFVGNCDAVYTHYIHPDSSAKLLSPKRIDFARTDYVLRKIFKEKGIYANRRAIFEFIAYKNLVNAIKIFHHFSKDMTAEEYSKQSKRLRESYNELDKKVVISQFVGFPKFYNAFLLSDFSLMSFFYKYKK
ncbi:glycosyltransferase family 2 protein [Chryseobacterium indoltheticum]|uniref:Glycosyltransferase involved in cell wall bisynthesis n=1 Tax=Chryseobacterium indoltheticum TaxID=254 RepID=A0A381F7E4_9FLAO|nr:glycosyltransferase family 2 protein [Chryseobacterium indoltheticum]AZA72798.1 glycosyltransferase family 2 protein [Chryseobacterium indoltheticum]SIP87030.1 Glycosyltransferase involved in cell wall bisynthesis [Chryseobacterium indoltheticum]SUX42398.1 Hyaluronan synthase [Chryseobacterium indoltheticum]